MRFELSLRVRGRLEAAVDCAADALAVVGPSGAGKTTLLEAVAGLLPGASVRLDGEDLSVLPAHRRGLGYLPQEAALFPHLSVRENLLYSPRAQGLSGVPEALGIDRLLGRMPGTLSGGERRRVALGRALLSRPRLLLLDEPFAGLDEDARREAMGLLDSARRRYGVPILLVSHSPAEVVALTDRALRLEAGRVVSQGASAAVLRSGEHAVDNFLTGTAAGKDSVSVDGVTLTVPLPEGTRGAVRLACYAQDLLLASARPSGLSARNIFQAEVAALEHAPDAALVTLKAPALRAWVTEASAAELGLAPGRTVWVVLKATALAYLGPA